jgi:hypothetical protein
VDKDQPGITPEEFHRIEGMMKFERLAMSQGYSWIAGLDEAGRGPLAGPVVAGAVILPDTFALADINDSKQLTPTGYGTGNAGFVLSICINISVHFALLIEVDARINDYSAFFYHISRNEILTS